MVSIKKIGRSYHSRAFLVRWFPIIITVIVAVFLMLFLVVRNVFSDEIIISDDGYFLSSDSEIGVLKQNADNLKVKLDKVDVKSGDTIYRSLLGSYFSADRANPINFGTPQFVGNGTTIINYNENVNLIDVNLARMVGYKSMMISYGKNYDLYTFKQMEANNYLLLGYENNVMVNLYDLQIQTLNGVYSVPVNSFVYFAEDYVNYYARTEDGFLLNRILGVDTNTTLTFRYDANNEKYNFNYGDFLDGIGTVYLRQEILPTIGETVIPIENSIVVQETVKKIKDKKDFEWIRPVVTDEEFSAGVFSARNKIEISDPAGVITSMPTYTFSHDGKVALRRSFTGTGDVLVSGLNASTTYDIVGQYTYLGSDLKTQYLVTFYVGTITTLGLETLEPINVSYDIDGIYPNKINLSNVKIVGDLASEAVLGVGKVGVSIDGVNYALSTRNMNELLNGSSITISTGEGLKSNQWYDFAIEFFDRVGNVLPASGNTGRWHTSKNMPSTTVRVVESNVEKVLLRIKQKNDDNVEIGNYHYVIYDANGGVVLQSEVNDDDIELTSLNANQLYTVKVFGSYDIEDGNGYIEDRLMGECDFVTASLASLGFLNIYYGDRQITHDSILLNFRIQQNKTNAILKRLTKKLFIEVYDASGTNMLEQKIYEGDELDALKNGDLLEVLFDGLDSETNYVIKTRSLAMQGETYYEADCIVNFTNFKTNKKAARVYLENSLVTENMIDFDVIVEDPDNAILSDKLRVELRDMNSKLVDADNIVLNSNEPVRLTYNNLTKNQNYTATFYVDEYNETDLGSTYQSKYELARNVFYTDNGISGGIELVSSTRQADGKNLADLNSTAKWIENANSSTVHHTVDKEGKLHLYSRSGTSTYTYDLSEYSGRMVKVSFQIKAVTPSSSGIYMMNYLTGTTSRQYAWKMDGISTNEWKSFSYTFMVGSYMASSGSTDVFLPQDSFLYGKNYNDTIGFYIAGGTSEYIVDDYQIQLFDEESFGDDMYGIEKGTWNTSGAKANNDNLARVDKLIEIDESAWYSFDFYSISNEYRAYFRIYNSNGTVYKNYGYYDNGCMIYVPEGKKIGVFFQRANGILEPEVERLHLKMTKNKDNTTSNFNEFSYKLNTQVKLNITDLRGEITNDDYYIKAYNDSGVEVFSERYDGLADEHVLRDVIKTIDCPEGGQYVIELGFKIRDRYYTLNSFELSTVDEVNGVGSVDEFRWIQPYGSYVVQNDLNFGTETFYLGYDKNYFNGTIDYQGHTMTVYTAANASLRKFYQVGTAAKMKNLVLDVHANQTTSFYNEGFITYLRGSVENLIINVYEDRSESVYDYRFVLFNYYLMASGKISNFVINLKNDLYVYTAASTLVYYNRGNISNGYVYGADMVADHARSSSRNIQFIEAYGYTNSMVSNVYILSNIRYPNNGPYDCTGLVAWETYGDVENVYVVGNTNKSFPAVGPVVGYMRGMSKISNVYYMSDTLYTASYLNRINALALNSPLFQKSVLSDEHFNIDEMLDIGYYPQVKFTSNSMPKQEYIPLPKTEAEKIDIISTEIMEQTDNSARIQMVISNPYGETIDEIGVSNISATIESQYYTEGNSYVTLLLHDPQSYRSRYSVRSVKTSYSDGSVSTKTYNDGEKNINVSFYRIVASVDDFAKIRESTYDNYSIVEDLDFSGYTKNYYIETFYGKIKGNGHALKNISVTSNRYGLINTLYGQIFDLVIDGYRKTNYAAAYNGIIGATKNGAALDNLHIKNVLIEIPDNATGSIYIGGLVGYSDYTRYSNLSVSDVKITSNATMQTITAGGLVGYFYYGDITNTFVSDLDISIRNVFYTNGIGGLVGRSSSTESFIENVYTTGSIETNCITSGGLVGVNYGFITNSYSAVDLASYLDNIGGIAGQISNGTVERNLYVGNIYTYYTNGLVGRVTANSSSYTNNFAAEDSLINGVKSTVTMGETLLSRNELMSENAYKNVIQLGDEFDYARVAEGILPKLYRQGTKDLLPGQVDTLIQEEEVLPILEVKKLSQSIEGSRLQIVVGNPEDYVVTGIEVEDMTVDSEKFQVSYDVQEKRTYIIATVTPNKYYDSYRFSKIYFKENEDGVERIAEKYFKIDMQFYHWINSVEDWQNIDSTDTENYILATDLDFTNVQNPNVSLSFNRLITDGDDVRHTIKNLNLAYTAASDYEGLIRRVVVEMKNINFDNIVVTDTTSGVNNYINLININYGDIRNCDFSNVEFNTPKKNYVGIVGANSGKNIHFVNLDNVTVSGNDYIAGVVASQDDHHLEDIIVSNSHISGRNYISGVVAKTKASTTNVKRLNVVDSGVFGTDYIGGAISNGRCDTCKANNIDVAGSTYVGGIVGYGNGANNVVEGSRVEGIKYVGGVYGYSNSATQYSYLIDSDVLGNTANAVYVGGILGGSSSGGSYLGVVGSTIRNLGNSVGGVVGYADGSSISSAYINNSDVSGEKNVGGIVGNIVNDHLYRCVVGDTDIIARTEAAGGVVGLVDNSKYSNGYMQQIAVESSRVRANKKAGGIIGAKGKNLSSLEQIYSIYFEGDVISESEVDAGIAIGDGGNEQILSRRSVGFYKDSTFNSRRLVKIANNISTGDKNTMVLSGFEVGGISTSTGEIYTDYYDNYFAGHSDFIPFVSGKTYDLDVSVNTPDKNFAVFFYDNNFKFLSGATNINGYIDKNFSTDYATSGSFKALRNGYFRIMVYNRNYVDSIKVTITNNDFYSMNERQLLSADELRQLITWSDYYSGANISNYDITKLAFSASYFDFSPIEYEEKNLTINDLSGSGHDGSAQVSGVTSKGFVFDGKDDYIKVSGFNGGGAFTISAKIRHMNTTNGYVFYYGDASNASAKNGFGVNIGSNQVYTKLNNTTDYSTYAYIGVRTEATLTVTYDGKTLNTYIDGVLVGTRDITNVPIVPSNAVAYVGYAPGKSSFSGMISNVVVYNRALSGTEVGQNFRSAGVAVLDGLNLYYDLTGYEYSVGGNYPQLKSVSYQKLIPLPTENSFSNGLLSTFGLMNRSAMKSITNSVSDDYHVYASGVNLVNLEFDRLIDGAEFSYTNGDYVSSWVKVEDRVYSLAYDYENDLTINVKTDYEVKEIKFKAKDLAKTVAVVDGKYYHVENGTIYQDDNVFGDDVLNIYDGQALVKGGKILNFRDGTEYDLIAKNGVMSEAVPLYVSEYDGATVRVFYNFSTINNTDGVAMREAQLVAIDGNLISFRGNGKNNATVFNFYNSEKYLISLSNNGEISSHLANVEMGAAFNNSNIVELAFDYRTREPNMVIRYNNGYVLALNYLTGENLYSYGNAPQVSLFNFMAHALLGSSLYSTSNAASYSNSKVLSDAISGTNNEEIMNLLVEAIGDAEESQGSGAGTSGGTGEVPLKPSGQGIGKNIISYDARNNKYEVVNMGNLVGAEVRDKEESLNQIVESSAVLYDFYYPNGIDSDEVDENKVLIYGIIIAVVVINLVMFAVVFVRKVKHGNAR